MEAMKNKRGAKKHTIKGSTIDRVKNKGVTKGKSIIKKTVKNESSRPKDADTVKEKADSSNKNLACFEVEKIVDTRILKDSTDYLLKIKGYPDEFNFWIPQQFLPCPELARQFEDARRSHYTCYLDSFEGLPRPKGFDRNLQPELIIGATNAKGYLEFLMKWVDTDVCELVPASEANAKCPQLVIRFYEDRIHLE